MNAFHRIVAPLLLVLTLLPAGFATAEPSVGAAKYYICPPCSLPCDTTRFDSPGVCPTCGMTLVEAGAAAAQAAQQPERTKVAILVFNGVEILDFTGPYEMFGAAGCDVYLVGETKDPVTTAMGMTVTPKFTFAGSPQPDVLVIPGGGVRGASKSEPTLAWIRDVTAHTRNTMSVCNGAFILASTGLLDGLTATTTNGNIPLLASQFPKIKVVRDQRYVDNGQLITCAGLSAGIDGALHVIARRFGDGVAEKVALVEEYDWKAGRAYARAALADQLIPRIDMEGLGKWDVVRTEGDTRRWDLVVRGEPNAPAEIGTQLEQALAKGGWTKSGSAGSGAAPRTSTWHFTGRDGKPWRGSLKVERADETGRHFLASLSIARTG